MLAVQATIALLMPVLPEEAYHWNFARHLDWSYYDHPPMLAWSIALGRSLLGDIPLGLRLVPLLYGVGTAWLLARLARQFYGGSAAVWVVFLYALEPAAFFVGSWGFPDAPLLFFWTLTLTWVWQALATRRPGWWLAAGSALGAGMLSKYTAAFLVPAVLLYLLFSARDRHWLLTPWPYLAGVCALVVFAPVIYWNWTHDWASFRFQSTARFQAADRIELRLGLQSLGEQWLMIVPLTLPLAIVALEGISRSSRLGDRYLFWSFVPMAVFFTLLGWTPSFHLLWPLPGYLGLTVAMAGTAAQLPGRVARFYRPRWPWLVGLGVLGATALSVHGALILPRVPPLREIYGWDEVAAQARIVHAQMPQDSFYLAVGGRPYPPPSQLAYHLDAPYQVYGGNMIGRNALQYRFWTDLDRLGGKDAVVVIEGGDPNGWQRDTLLKFFRTVDLDHDMAVPMRRHGLWPTPTVRFTLYRARGYHASSMD
jgi:dolichol-phosphate mannosyltransferase